MIPDPLPKVKHPQSAVPIRSMTPEQIEERERLNIANTASARRRAALEELAAEKRGPR